MKERGADPALFVVVLLQNVPRALRQAQGPRRLCGLRGVGAVGVRPCLSYLTPHITSPFLLVRWRKRVICSSGVGVQCARSREHRASCPEKRPRQLAAQNDARRALLQCRKVARDKAVIPAKAGIQKHDLLELPRQRPARARCPCYGRFLCTRDRTDNRKTGQASWPVPLISVKGVDHAVVAAHFTPRTSVSLKYMFLQALASWPRAL